MGIRFQSGRNFSEADVAGSEAVAIVSKGLAARYWPIGEALGKRVAVTDRVWRRIVGVVEDVKNDGLEASAKPTIYIPFAQFPRQTSALVVRADRDLSAALTAIRGAVHDVSPTQPVFGAQTMNEALGQSLALRRFVMLLVTSFAGIAVVLGLVGVYGVLSYLMMQRRPEIAIRLALGAARSEIVWLVARRGVFLGCVGVTLGLATSLLLSRLLEGVLFGVSPVDAATYVLAPVLLLIVVVAVSSLPALQAMGIPAAEALRAD
jgi:ABC-type antimicrobial peptide transport system permease subunit